MFLDMATLPNTIWFVALAYLITATVSEDACQDFDSDLKITPFECNLNIHQSLTLKMQCETGDISIAPQYAKRYFLDVEKEFTFEMPFDFSELKKRSSLSVNVYCHESFISQKYPHRMEKRYTYFFEDKIKDQFLHALKEAFITNFRLRHTFDFDLAFNILRICPNLTMVCIYNSSLTDLTIFPFNPNNSISVLILKENKIKSINDQTFKNLPNLTDLDLSKNELKHINNCLFDGLVRVVTLDLSFNLIQEVPNNTFYNLITLEKLNIQSNSLQYINEGIFQLNKLLQIVDISHNDIKILPPAIFRNLKRLANVSCSDCSLSDLNKNLLKDNLIVQYVMFSHNHIQCIPEGFFKNLKLLKYVDLGFNNIKELNKNMFPNNPFLWLLNMTHNEISSLTGGVFGGETNIGIIDLRNNQIETLNDEHDDFFSDFFDLEYLDIRNNNIETVLLRLERCVYVRKLLLSNNLISNFTIRWSSLVTLESLEVDHNQLTSLDLPPCIPIENSPQQIEFSFKYNRISELNLDSLTSDEMKLNTDWRLKEYFCNGLAKNNVNIWANPLNCDCKLYAFYKYISKRNPKQYQLENFLVKDNLTCASPPSLVNERIINLKDEHFSCPLKNECPTRCSCYARAKDNMTHVNCSKNNLNKFPQSIPEQTKVIYFNENNLESMITLNLPALDSLIELHLDGNLLTSLNDWNYSETLRYLSVRRNKLKYLSSSLIHFISNQINFQLYFGNNDKNCSCDRLDFKNFLVKNIQFVGDLDSIVCKVIVNETSVYVPLSSVADNDLCLDEPNDNQKNLIISLILIFTLLLLVLLMYYKQRQLILSFFYIHCDILYRLCYTEDEYDKDKIFDAFIAYSSRDRDIVMNLLQELENRPPFFKLCIHERNWLPGRFICDNILSSVESSKRTIILLSETFITSPWFNLELRAAVSKMAKDKISRIIIVLTEKTVSLSNIDPELRHVISKRTYLVWKERWFWEKLRYTMPRKKVTKGNGTVICHFGRTREASLLSEAI